jgi:hypothetical protein
LEKNEGDQMQAMVKWLALGSLAVFAGLQIVPPPIQPLTQPTDPHAISFQNIAGHEVGAILDRACKDCHSNNTNVPWYGHVAPVSWLLAKHVRDGQRKLNFSDWDSRRPSSNEMEEICDAVSNKSMPLPGYTMIHRDARLSKHDVDSICTWADTPLAQKYVPLQASPPMRGQENRDGRASSHD